VYVGSDGLHPSFFIVSYVCLLACIGRPKHSAWLTSKQRTFFNEKKIEVEAAQRLLLPAATTQEVGDKAQEENAEAERVDVPNETEEEMDRNEEKAANFEEARVNVQNEVEDKLDGNEEKAANTKEAKLDEQSVTMDDDVSRKDSFYDTKADDNTASVQLLLLIGVIVGLAVTWYLSKLQRKRSGLHKKLDGAAVYDYRPASLELSYC
jgi:hypothetical protein